MSDSVIRTELRDSVGHIWLARPAKRNALSVEMIVTLTSLLRQWRHEAAIRAITLRGDGGAFCSGADIDDLQELVRADPIRQREFQPIWEDLIAAFQRVGKPCIGGIHGKAFAGGFVLVLLCDMIFAADDTKFGLPEVKIGMWPLAVSVLLARAVGARRALEMMLVGETFDAARAEHLGIVSKVVAPGELASAVEKTACQLAAQSASTMRVGRDVFYAMQSMNVTEAMALMREAMPVILGTRDAREGIASFLERRAPQWD